MSLKANCCPRCLTLKTDEPGQVHTCSPTLLVRELEQKLQSAILALDYIASWGEGENVSSLFDEPAAAQIARDTLKEIK